MAPNLLIVGAAGRMGQRITDLAQQEGGWHVFYGLESENKKSPLNIPCWSDRGQLQQADVVIDFTVAEATAGLLDDVVKAGKPYVIGTTGFSPEQDKRIAEAAKRIPIVKSSNMSPGVNAFFKAAILLAKALPAHAVHIQETHHRHKTDSPSGTALQAGRLIEQAGTQKVTYESFREGEVIGDHRIIFRGPLDEVALSHHADSRDIFAAGALQAARWVRLQKPGLYSMFDVLGLP
jgi:4-hydroxy-tetrahydrodipicolinate reductase